MAQITLQGSTIETVGMLPPLGSPAPDFTLTKTDLSDVNMGDFAGKKLLLNIFPSIDTPICADSVRRFNSEAGRMENIAVLCISADLPFAHARFCGAEDLDNVIALSTFRFPQFGNDYGVAIKDGPLAGLMSRAIVIVDESGKVTYSQQVPEIKQEPNYGAALDALKSQVP